MSADAAEAWPYIPDDLVTMAARTDDLGAFRRYYLNTWRHDTQEPPASVPLEQPSERRVHAADSGGGPASPLGTSGPAACQAPGSLGRHPIPAGAPASCPCGRVRRYPPARP